MTKKKNIKIFSILIVSVILSLITYFAFKPIFNYDFWVLAIVFILLLHIICFALCIVEDESIPFKLITIPIPKFWGWLCDDSDRMMYFWGISLFTGVPIALLIAYFPLSIALSLIVSPIAYLIYVIKN